MIPRMTPRYWLKTRCLHFWRTRYGWRGGRECDNCHDRRMAGGWFFRTLGFK